MKSSIYKQNFLGVLDLPVIRVFHIVDDVIHHLPVCGTRISWYCGMRLLGPSLLY